TVRRVSDLLVRKFMGSPFRNYVTSLGNTKTQRHKDIKKARKKGSWCALSLCLCASVSLCFLMRHIIHENLYLVRDRLRCTHQKRRAFRNARDQRRPAVVLCCGVAHDLPHSRPVVIFDSPAERVSHQLFGKRARELLRLIEQRCAQTSKPLDLSSASRHSPRVDWPAGFVNRSPSADHVEILQRKAEGIQNRMAAVASWAGTMLRQSLAYRFRHGAGLVCQICVDSGRRRRHGQSKDVVQQKFPA